MNIEHANHTTVMHTLVEPATPYFRYEHGMYAYLHPHAAETADLSAREVMIEEVIDLNNIVVRYCNSDELFTVSQDKLSAPIWV